MEDLMFEKLTPEQKEWFPEFVKLLLENKPYLLSIDEAVTKLNNGAIAITLRVYQGRVTDVLLHETKRIVYKTNGESTTTKQS